jgi:perosamine synthetase
MPLTASNLLPFHKAYIEQDDIEAVTSVLRSGWLTTGTRTREFEAAFSNHVGASHAVALSSCTAALHLALLAVGVSEGDEVIVPTMTFSSTGEVVLYPKARPVLVDCEPNSFQIDPEAVERAITPRTRAIIPVHFAGSPANLERLLEIARLHKIKVVEDAAHAFPTRYKGRMIGSFGEITCFSFYATKTITTGEGGMITTENPEYAERIRILSLHGISKDAYKRYTSEGTWRYEILDVGYKYNLTDMQAALGFSQLAKCGAMREKRQAVAERYQQGLADLDICSTPAAEPGTQHAWHLFVLQLNLDSLRITRDRVIEELKERGVGTSVHFIPLHLHPYYQQQFGYRAGDFPSAEHRFERAISLPIYPGMSMDDVDQVIQALHDISAQFRR